MMKKLHSILAMLMLLAFGLSFTSCSSDDEEEGGTSGVKTCYIKVDGKQIDFNYAYYYEEGNMDSEIQFSTVDLLYYLQNPDKIKKGILISMAYIEFEKDLTSGTTLNYEFEVEYNQDLFFAFDNPDEGDEEWQPGGSYNWYINDWDKENTPLNITKSNTYYKISASSIPMMASDGDDGFDSMVTYRKTTADLYFEGTPIDIRNLAISEYSKSVTVVKVDKPTMQLIKKIRKTIN